MNMTQAQFEKLIKNLDLFARQHPQQYKRQVKWLANLGYAYIILLILLLLGLTTFLIYFGLFFTLQTSVGFINVFLVCLSLLPLTLTLIIFKSLKVYFPKPKGLKLNRQKVPELFQLIDELSSSLQAPNFEHILLTGELNASVIQLPSFFKFQENYLLVGLPLMCTLSLQQFRAVLAHELGHLSRNHGQLSGQVYLVRQTWYQVWKKLQQSNRGSTFLVNLFLNWYAPFLYAYSFVMARTNEYEADLCAIESAGVDSMGEALISLEITGKYLETCFWTTVYKQAYHESVASNAVYTNLLDALSKKFSLEEKVRLLDLALDQRTSYSNTHPCLSERLTQIGYNPVSNNQLVVPDYPKVNAAQNLLNGSLESFISHFNEEWQRQISFRWREWHNQAQEFKMRIEYLERQAKNQPLRIDNAWELANLVYQFKGDEAAIPKLRNVINIDPKHSDANYLIGSIILDQGNAQGIQHIETAIEQDYEKGVSGYEIIRTFMRQKGNLKMADCYREHGDLHYQLFLLAQEERSLICAHDKFITHNLSKDILRSLSRQLSDYPQVKEGYIFKKFLKYFPEKPLYVLGIVRYKIFNEQYRFERDQELLYELNYNLDFPYSLKIILLNFYQWNWKRVLSNLPNSKINIY